MEWPAPLPNGVELLEYQLEEQVMRIVVLGIDLGKNVCSVVGFDENGAASSVGAQANHALTFKPDHPVGADHLRQHTSSVY